MTQTPLTPSRHPLREYIQRLEMGQALLADSPGNTLEVVGILKSYGVVLDAYAINLQYIAQTQYLNPFPFFKYFNGRVTTDRLLKHWWHDRLNYEYAEYCMKAMMWHGGGELDKYLDGAEFRANAAKIIKVKIKNNPLLVLLNKIFPEFLPEQMRMMAYYAALGQFWRVMADMFASLSDRYDRGEVTTILDVVQHIQDGLVANAAKPITYQVQCLGRPFDILPARANLAFLMETAVPYVEAVFFRGTPFPGTISYNAQAGQIPSDQSLFTYGALYADPLPIGGAGIPPTLLMQDMRHFLPDYLHQVYRQSLRREDDLLVQICESFQKSMFCVTTAAIRGLAPHPFDSHHREHQRANRAYLENWMNRFTTSRVEIINQP